MGEESEELLSSEAEDSQAEAGSSDEESSDAPPSPKVELPDRNTRGKRMGTVQYDAFRIAVQSSAILKAHPALPIPQIVIGSPQIPSMRKVCACVQLMADEGSADEDFWKQDFFAEEKRDDAYQESTEEEDVPDTDFSESVRHLLALILSHSVWFASLWCAVSPQ